MITNKQILQEVEDLKLKLKSGETEIPSMWCCFWPGISVLLWMIGWPLIIYGYKMHFLQVPGKAQTAIAVSVAIGFAAGLFIMLNIVNGRALYLSIPKSFRVTSALCRFISTKFRGYLLTYIISYAALIVVCSLFVYGPVYSCVLTIVGSFGLMMYMNVDLNRYQLTALTSLLESIKGKETNPEQ
ncbi:conjugal transfer protein TraS [Klebsiella oxytoca]|uniref:conjugal transfer protein TraS n=1 Tax=Klebsiella oxytoca TaxID=571 RepID=UPI0011578881|nr:conjugal transfer protein TraS [Klebsiella oxytoca]HAT1582293.1 conjugal transfer protein TraS [Raoultella ornithinolytica]HAT1670504.1 conjugal transfer protein TraS [Raoultella ornithinolytica]HCJ6654086.1 conjugal transfer protein TraS [Klebsiella oxytoca]HCJ7378837.1 conjugal transfer protein TraS [Klebsiella oxytoca]HDX4249543.1 conjugal transfer protein TraS [Klebsiella oxytoca]